MTTIDNVTAKGQLLALTFMQADVAASQSAVALTVAEVRDVAASADDQNAAPGYVIPWDFEIVGISVLSSAARTAGVLTVDATINGTAQTAQAILNATNTTAISTKVKRETKRGLANSYVGCKITTDGSWTPITADISVTVYVLCFLSGI